MTDPSTPSAQDRIHAALHANCDALIALELTCALARAGADIGEFSVPAAKAVEALRIAIGELRLAVGETSPAAGFVLPDKSRGDALGDAPRAQAKRRRTA